MRIYIIIALAAAIFTIHQQARAGDWSVGYLATSWHLDDDYSCFDGRRDYNADQHGLYVKYKALVIGRYENSKSGCDGAKYSNFIGMEAPLWSLGQVDFSVMGAIADGYPNDDDSSFGEYQPTATLNAKWKVIKIFYGYSFIGLGLHYDL